MLWIQIKLVTKLIKNNYWKISTENCQIDAIKNWIFFGRTDAEAETPTLWPPDAKNWLVGKDPDAGKDWGQEEKGEAEDDIVGWHHWLNGHEFEQTQGGIEG